IVYLLDPNGARLRWAHDAGISNDTERGWVRELEMPLGVGMFGRATQERRVLITGDYLPDPKFAHGADPDRVAREVGIRSMVVAPMDAAAGPLGALGALCHARGRLRRERCGANQGARRPCCARHPECAAHRTVGALTG
nr:GAF domain-containing protein [Chloroflexota bacterium]